MKYRKRPVVIEAERLTRQTVDTCLKFAADSGCLNLAQTFDKGIIIPTLEGNHLASYGDFIIKGVQGEFYPCKPDIFMETYEAVDGV